MKVFAILVFLAISLTGSGQLIDELPKDENGNLNFNKVIQVEGTTKDDLYLRSKQFFVDTFKSAKDVIQMDDKEAGIVIGKGYSRLYVKSLGTVVEINMWYSVKIQSKDGRYRYEVYDILYKGATTGYASTPSDWFKKDAYYKKNGEPRDINEKYKNETVSKATALTALIEESMNKSSVSKGSEKGDW